MSTAPDAVRSPADVDDPDDLERRHVVPSELGEVTVEESEDGKPRITVPISSTAPHRSDGKIMTEEALEGMAEQLESGEVGLWDDHGLSTLTGWREYRREDMYGRWVAGEVDEDGVLWGTAELMAGRPEAATLVEQLDQDMPVGFSVGYQPLQEEMLAVDGDEDGDKTRHIMEVDLWETSPVGIPDNPNAIAAAGAIAAELDRADADLEGGPEEIASAFASSVREAIESDSMSDTTEDESTETASAPEEGADADTDPDAGDVEARDLDQEDVMDVVDDVFAAARAKIRSEIAENDEDDDDEEESADVDLDLDRAGADDGKDDVEILMERIDAVEQRNKELEEANEELRATVERLESETRESAGRKGISPAAAGGDDDAGDGGSEAASSGDRPRNALEEAERLRGQ